MQINKGFLLLNYLKRYSNPVLENILSLTCVLYNVHGVFSYNFQIFFIRVKISLRDNMLMWKVMKYYIQ
jgi:hypothetical protein